MRICTNWKTKSKSSRAVAVVALAALLHASAVAPSRAADTQPISAKALIEKTVVQVLKVLRDNSRSTAQRRLELEKIAHDCFDFRTMARLVLGRDWKRLDAA